MNSRVIPPAVKALNRRRRIERDVERKNKNRRRTALALLGEMIAVPFSALEFDNASEAITVLGRHLNAAKPVMRRKARAALLIQRGGNLTARISDSTSHLPVRRPERLVHRSRMPLVHPWLVAEEPFPPADSLEAALYAIHNLAEAGAHPYHLLDITRSATRLSWQASLTLLVKEGLIAGGIDDEAIKEIGTARYFWFSWQDARRIYGAAIMLAQIRAAAGDWGLLTPDTLGTLLPGFDPPKSERRDEYAVRIQRSGGVAIGLDFHASPSYRPLFRLRL